MEDHDNHKAETLFKQFRKHLGHIQNWPPGLVQRKLNLKSNRVFKSKEKTVRGTDDFLDETEFKSNLQNSTNFIACFETRNLRAQDPGQQNELQRFLEDIYGEHFIWGVGRAAENTDRFTLKNYSQTYIAIPDLNFGADRRNPISVHCPITDIVMVCLLKENYGVSILFDNKYHKLIKHRSGRYIQPAKKYKTFFKRKNKPNADKENINPDTPGPSGLNSQRSDGSSSSVPDQSNLSSANSEVPDSVLSQTSSSNTVPPSNTVLSQTSSSNTVPPSSVCHEDHIQLSSDENDVSDEDEKCSIVFKGQYAEITSCGITKKVMIGSSSRYPKQLSKVGFQIEKFQLIFIFRFYKND